MTHAFIDAELLSEAIGGVSGEQALDHALADYEEKRLLVLKPSFDATLHAARLEPVGDTAEAMLRHTMRSGQPAHDGFISHLDADLDRTVDAMRQAAS